MGENRSNGNGNGACKSRELRTIIATADVETLREAQERFLEPGRKFKADYDPNSISTVYLCKTIEDADVFCALLDVMCIPYGRDESRNFRHYQQT